MEVEKVVEESKLEVVVRILVVEVRKPEVVGTKLVVEEIVVVGIELVVEVMRILYVAELVSPALEMALVRKLVVKRV